MCESVHEVGLLVCKQLGMEQMSPIRPEYFTMYMLPAYYQASARRHRRCLYVGRCDLGSRTRDRQKLQEDGCCNLLRRERCVFSTHRFALEARCRCTVMAPRPSARCTAT